MPVCENVVRLCDAPSSTKQALQRHVLGKVFGPGDSRGACGHGRIESWVRVVRSRFDSRESDPSDGEPPFMNSVIDHWKTRLIALPPSERVELAHFLLSSLEPDDEGVEASWDAEASRRVAEIRSGRATGRPVDEFMAELRERYP